LLLGVPDLSGTRNTFSGWCCLHWRRTRSDERSWAHQLPCDRTALDSAIERLPTGMDTDRDRTIVIGGGIVGLATALTLAGRGKPPIVLEAENRVAAHQTGHNSGVIHSGLYYKPGSVKARTCREGLAAMYRFCAEEGVAHKRCGKLVVATRTEELTRLAALEERGRANGVVVKRLRAEQLKDYEPEVVGIAGLWVEETGIVDYSQVAEAMSSRLVRLGGEVRMNNRVLGIRRDGARIILETTGGELRASQMVNCAGLQSDRIARLAGIEPGVRIVPFRGEYYRLRHDRSVLVRGLIYPVPDPALPFLGVHFTRGIDGVVEAGPNAVLALKREGYRWADISFYDVIDWASFRGFWRMARAQWRTGVSEIARSLSRRRFLESLRILLPNLGDDDIERGGSGVRAQAVGQDGKLLDDFCILEAPGMVHVLNAPSPAATASLAIGRNIADRILQRRN
jgi:L-2-hydroxyglutarate oxidase